MSDIRRRLRDRFVEFVDHQTERVSADRLGAKRAPRRVQRLMGAIGAEHLLDWLNRLVGGDVSYLAGRRALKGGRYLAAATYFHDSARAFASSRADRRDRAAAAGAMRAWSLARGGRPEEALPILEALLTEIRGVPAVGDERPVWPGQTIRERREWLEANLRWVLKQIGDARR